MLKLKILVIILFLLLIYQINPLKTAYFKAWNPKAVQNYPALNFIVKELKNSGYRTTTNVPSFNIPPIFSFLDKSIYLILWSHFDLPPLKAKEKSFLWQLESPISIIIPPTEEYKKHFKKIFTYYKPACDNKQIIYTPIPYEYSKIKRNIFTQQKTSLVSLMNTYSTGYQYDLRNKIIRWFLENHPQDILFYGKDWEPLKNSLSKKAKPFFDTQYKGPAQDKIETIKYSKFNLAFENERFDHYVTEKIYDAMAAGSVPVYSGAPNITDYVPKECFIDYHQFNDFGKLYQFLSTMDNHTYHSYLHCINEFMNNPERHPNHYKNVGKKILEEILK